MNNSRLMTIVFTGGLLLGAVILFLPLILFLLEG